ncbi:MAG: hypothetical protein ACK4FB_12675 [Brevundimonas sp.]|uniref:hypothetical protein n=1 Tax=Brevundimonas sp. TaxID=1871086 RepID=UPI00391A659E
MLKWIKRLYARRVRWMKAKSEHLRFKYLPGIAQRLLHWSTWQARKSLAGNAPLVLVDSSVLHHAVTHETVWIDTGESLWGGVVPINTGYMARVPVHRFESDVAAYSDILFLPGLAYLGKLGSLRLRTSAELMAEREAHPPARFRATGMFDHNLFGGGELESVDGRHWDGIFGSAIEPRRSPRDIQQERLAASDDPLYRALLEVLGAKNSQDAWHIRTAEVHEMLCFLTMDHRLIRAMRAQARHPVIKNLKTRVLTPAELGKELDILPFPPLLLSYTDASYPVRTDVTQIDEKRRPARRSPR